MRSNVLQSNLLSDDAIDEAQYLRSMAMDKIKFGKCDIDGLECGCCTGYQQQHQHRYMEDSARDGNADTNSLPMRRMRLGLGGVHIRGFLLQK